jgi:hypothetical protein
LQIIKRRGVDKDITSDPAKHEAIDMVGLRLRAENLPSKKPKERLGINSQEARVSKCGIKSIISLESAIMTMHRQ